MGVPQVRRADVGEIFDTSATAGMGMVHVPASGDEFFRPADWVPAGQPQMELQGTGAVVYIKDEYDEGWNRQWQRTVPNMPVVGT